MAHRLSFLHRLSLGLILATLGMLTLPFAELALAREASSRAHRRSTDLLLSYGTEGYSLGLVGDTAVLEFTYSGLASSEDGYRHGYQIGLKNFHGNSFYSRFFMTARQAGHRLFPAKEADYTHLLAGVSLGNQWQWRYLTFGIDWVRLAVPVATIVRKDSHENEASTQQAAMAKLNRLEVQALGLTVGMAF